MEHVTQVEAEPREEFGKNAARRLRRAGRIPAVLYGGGGPAISVTVDPKKISQILTSGASHNAPSFTEYGRALLRIRYCSGTMRAIRRASRLPGSRGVIVAADRRSE